MSILSNDASIVPTVEESCHLVERCIQLGAVEGFDGRSIPLVDGRNLEQDSMCLRQIRQILELDDPSE